MQIDLDLTYTDAQSEIFFESTARKRIITKGRRLGLTRGASQAFPEYMIDKNGTSCLWGDTVNGNIDRYIERYWMPILKQIPKGLWNYEKVAKKLTIGDSYCDFRSADNPENWEGFGYDYIFLNEAGIILRNPYLYENAVRPMLLDNPESILIAGGTPKGKTPPIFYDLWMNGQNGMKDFQSFQFSTYDNPYLSKGEIDDLIAEMSDAVVNQEIYGQFTDSIDFQLIEGQLVEDAIARDYHPSQYMDDVKVLGVDLAGSGLNKNAAYKRQGLQTIGIETQQTLKAPVLVAWIARIIIDWEPDATFIDGGYNPAVIDMLQDLGHDVIKVDFGGASGNPHAFNKRAEMWMAYRDWLGRGGSIPNYRNLRRGLLQQTFKFAKKDGSIIQLTSKEDMIKAGLVSSDEGDSGALTFAFPVKKKTAADTYLLNRRNDTYQTEYDPFAM